MYAGASTVQVDEILRTKNERDQPDHQKKHQTRAHRSTEGKRGNVSSTLLLAARLR